MRVLWLSWDFLLLLLEGYWFFTFVLIGAHWDVVLMGAFGKFSLFTVIYSMIIRIFFATCSTLFVCRKIFHQIAQISAPPAVCRFQRASDAAVFPCPVPAARRFPIHPWRRHTPLRQRAAAACPPPGCGGSRTGGG